VNKPLESSSSKVPEITFAFWVMKVAATTVGETGGDAVSMTMHLGYALSSAIFLASDASCSRPRGRVITAEKADLRSRTKGKISMFDWVLAVGL
jgi:Repeat of Unknown Function (DUF347)